VVRRGLEKYVVGRTLHTVEVLHPRAVRRHPAGPGDFAAATRGLTITGARRRGKYLWLPAVRAPVPGAAVGAAGAGPAAGSAGAGGAAGAAGSLAAGELADAGLAGPELAAGKLAGAAAGGSAGAVPGGRLPAPAAAPAVPNSAVPNSAGPNSAGPNSAGPNSAGPNSAGPNLAGPGRLAVPALAGPVPVVPGAELDLGDGPAVTGDAGAALAAAVAEAAPVAGPGAEGVLSVAEDALLAHLGMSGQLLLGDPARPLSPHVRIRFTFTDEGPDLRFTDQRTFGHLMLDPGGAALPALIAHIAPDPMEDAYDEAAVIARLRTRRTGIKAALLDQSLISGIGNIYADEALWRARIHWARPAAAVARAGAAPLLAAVREVLAEALRAGGTSFDSLYVNVNGESGYFGRSLAVYGREREPCPRCGTPIRRDPFMNRSAYSCPTCQPRPRGLAPRL
jgi:formamidopyrimidine-DNA glycosylase